MKNTIRTKEIVSAEITFYEVYESMKLWKKWNEAKNYFYSSTKKDYENETKINGKIFITDGKFKKAEQELEEVKKEYFEIQKRIKNLKEEYKRLLESC